MNEAMYPRIGVIVIVNNTAHYSVLKGSQMKLENFR